MAKTEESSLKKQSQFLGVQWQLKFLFERGL
jgi:hypothetical protein